MQLVEQIGSGIMRMNDLMKEAGLPLPEFTTEGMFTIKLQRNPETIEKPGHKLGDKLGDKPGDKMKEKTREKVLELISMNSKITIPELAKMLNITYKGVQYHLTEIKKKK